MKTRFKRISKRSLAMLLSVLMVLSVLSVGTLITANAAANGDWYVRGDNNNWSNSADPMTYTGTTNTYARKVTFASNGGFKIDKAPANWGEAYPSNNYGIGAGTYMIMFNSSNHTISPKVLPVNVTGTLGGSEWTPTDSSNDLSTTNDYVYTKTFSVTKDTEYKYKLTYAGSWDNAFGSGNNDDVTVGDNLTKGTDSDGNLTITPSKNGDLTFSYNYATNKLTLSLAVAVTPSISLSTDKNTLYIGGGVTDTATITTTKENTSATPSYSVTRNGSAATVNTDYTFNTSTGVFTPKKTGTFVVTGSITDGSTYTDSVTITVSDRVVYLLGLTNEGTWTPTDSGNKANKMTYNSSTSLYELTINLYQSSTTYNGNNGFKIQDAGVLYGKNSTTLTTSSTSASGLTTSGGNLAITTKNIGGNSTVPYKFTYNASTKAVTVYYPMKVTFSKNGHGSSDPATQVVAYGSTATNPGTLTASDGYTHNGKWYTESSCTNEFNFSTAITQDYNLYAKWTGAQKVLKVQAGIKTTSSGSYTLDDTTTAALTMDGSALTPAGSSGSKYQTKNVAVGDTCTLVAPNKGSGYTFLGWYNGNTRVSTNAQYTYTHTMANADTTLVARYERKYTLTINAGSNGKVDTNKTSLTKTVFYDDSPGSFTINANTGYEFDSAKSTNFSSYYTVSGNNATGKAAANITSANKVDKTVTVAFEEITSQVTFGAKKTDDGSTFTDLSGAVTAKYYDAAAPEPDPDPGSGSSGSGSDPEPSGGPYYLHIGKQNAFATNTAIQFTWNGSYYYASYNVDTASADYPFVINTKNTALGDSDKSSSNQSITALASSYNPDNISMWYTPVYNSNAYSGYDCFKFGVTSGSTGTIYITFTPSGGVTFRTSVSSGSSGSSGSGGSGGGESGSGTGYTGEGTTMTSPQSVPYGKVAVFTAEATKTVSGSTYHFAEWVDGSGTKLSSDNPYQITVTADKTVYARYYKVYKLSAFDSYTSDGTNVSFVTSPPKTITVKHGDETFIYNYSGTASTGNPDSPDGDKVAALPIASGTYGQGNYIQYYAGDEITLHYSAMASSEIFKGVFFNNSANYYVAKPTQVQYQAHDYSAGKTLYMNSNYYTTVPSGLPSTTVDHDSHSIKFTGTQDYKNIDIEIANKRKVYFSDYTNAVIGSKNTDDYYYDGEALSVTGDQLTVKAAGNATQTNSINKDNIKFYRADANGQKTGSELSGFTVAYDSGTDPVTNSGATASTRYIIISGNMPSYDLYIDLGMTSSYTIKLGSKLVSDLGGSKTRLREAATAVTATSGSTTLNCTTSADLATGLASVVTGSSVELTVSGLASGYMFVGWYWGSDSAPDYEKGFISDKLSLNYTPKKGGTIWAVGTKDLFINGSKYITGKASNWYAENSTQKNLEMSFDAETGRYYWEITDTMFAAAGNEYKTWEENKNNTTYGTYHKGGDNYYYWYDNDDKYHGKSFFQFFDTESGNNNKSIWNQLTSFKVDTPANGPTYGKIYPSADDYGTKTWNGQGFINFYESSYPGYSSPLRIYYDPNATDNAKLTVEATPIYSDLYVSNGYDVGSTVKSDAVTVEPVVDGVVKTSGQTGYFSVGAGTTYSPDHEGTVTKYTPAKKGATVRITKKAGGSDKIAAFLIYDTENRTVRAEKNITKGTTSNSKTPYYIDLTLENVKQSLYIVPIVEEAVPNGAKQVTITFDATQLNRKQWGDIVTAYAWYKTSNAPGLGAYPGQPMIPSDDMSTWTTSFVSIKSGNELAGITFSNYVDGTHSWLGCTGVMGTVSDAQQKSGEATGGIINVYNHVSSGDNGEYSRTNYKAQTYDYHEPIALYDRYKNEDSVNITFQMKDGNSSLISWRHHEFDDNNILNLPSGWGKLNWEYLTNAKGDQYVDMNGSPLGANNKPTATFYVAAKGQVVYNNSTMNYVFHGGHDYEMKGYTGTYSDPTGGADRGSYAKTALASGQWDDNITYGGTNSLDMKYGVQWYVYDAQGNYITTVLSAGIADLSSNNVDTYIAKELEDKGYAVDGKSVAICYDKPRYMYGDWTIANSAQNINSGPNFDAYRFEGQWIAAAQSDTVKVNVEVAMMTDSGEVLANSNTAGYGNATAGLKSGVTFGKPAYATSSSDGSWAQTAATDAKLNGIVLNASSQNFIGWYYYDANTNEFTKANYTGNENFYPNYTNKDVTYYAVYRASAIYQYHYRGREIDKIYSASGEDLTAAEMANDSKIDAASHEEDIKNKVPVGIGVFKKRIDFSPTSYSGWTKTSDPNGYILDITDFTTTEPEYKLTAYYKDTDGNQLATKTIKAVYNATAVNLTDLNGGTPVTSYHGKPFLGWYAYDGGEVGELISTQTNYGLRLTRNQDIIAVYDENGSTTVPEDGLHVSIDENEVNKELTTSDTGVFYNDTIVRVRDGSNVRASAVPAGATVGVLVVCDNKTNKTINNYNDTQLATLANSVDSGKTKKTAKGLSITNMQTTTLTSFNRTDIAVRRDYKTTLGAKYCVYAYIKDGSTYTFSDVSAVKTYE